MSDVAIAPAPAPAPAAPAPTGANEAPINPNPVNTPTPIGPQTPEAPAEDRPVSRRDAIQRAFDRAEKERGTVPPAKARMGHNQPPEDTPLERDRSKPKSDPGAPLNLRKRPDDQSKAEPKREPTPRAEHGHFAARAQDGAQPQPGRQQEQPTQYRQLPEGAPGRDPLPRMTPKAKADWHGTPDSVRVDVHRMHKEFGEAFLRYRGDHQIMNTIRPFAEMAHQHGTTLERALSNYTQMENKLRQDVVGGLDIIVSNLNLRSQDGRKLTLADVAWHVLNQTPEQSKLVQTQNATNAQAQQIGQLHQMVNSLAQGIGQLHYERKFTHTRSALDQYADKHPRFDELGDLIENEIKLGFDLDTAYRRAELLRPAKTAAQTRTSTTSAQTRTPDRSIHGGPDAGPSNGTSRRHDKPVGRREAIANAMKRINGSL